MAPWSLLVHQHRVQDRKDPHGPPPGTPVCPSYRGAVARIVRAVLLFRGCLSPGSAWGGGLRADTTFRHCDSDLGNPAPLVWTVGMVILLPHRAAGFPVYVSDVYSRGPIDVPCWPHHHHIPSNDRPSCESCPCLPAAECIPSCHELGSSDLPGRHKAP